MLLRSIFTVCCILVSQAIYSQMSNQYVDSTHVYTLNETGDTTAFDRFFYTLDDEFRTIEYISQSYGYPTNRWINKTKISNKFDERGNLLSIRWYLWDNASSSWKNFQRFEYGFDDRNNEILNSKYNWDDGLNEWVGDYKNERIFNERNDVIEETFSRWIADLKEYVFLQKTLTTFQGNQKQNTVYQDWNDDNMAWDNNEIYDYTYDEAGLLINETRSLWNADSSKFNDEYYKAEYTYLNTNHFFIIEYRWNQTEKQWIEFSKLERMVNEFNRLTYFADYGFEEDSVSGELKILGYSKSTTQYDDDGNRIETANYLWDSNNEDWYLDSKYENTYLDGKEKYVYGYELSDDQSKMVLSSITVNYRNRPCVELRETKSISICEGESYTFGSQTLTSAGEFTEVFESQAGCDSTVVLTLGFKTQNECRVTGITEGDLKDAVKIYPVPFEDDISIELGTLIQGEVQIHDITGALVFQRAINYDNVVKVNTIKASGTYLVTVVDDSMNKAVYRIVKP